MFTFELPLLRLEFTPKVFTHSLTRSHSCMLSALTNTPITNTPTAREYLGPELAAVL